MRGADALGFGGADSSEQSKDVVGEALRAVGFEPVQDLGAGVNGEYDGRGFVGGGIVYGEAGVAGDVAGFQGIVQ